MSRTHYPSPAVRGLHPVAQTARAKAAYVAYRGIVAATARGEAISRLPVVEWKGRPLYTICCTGLRGKGPHEVNVPESLLWALIDLEHFLCPFHA